LNLEIIMSRKLPYTDDEIVLAKCMFTKAQASGTLKSSRGLIAVALSSGYRHSVAQTPSYLDYLPDARERLAGPAKATGLQRREN
jgi:hypothetical protein